MRTKNVNRRRFTGQLLAGGLLAISPKKKASGNQQHANDRQDKKQQLFDAVTDGDLNSVQRILIEEPNLRTAKDAHSRSVFVHAHLERQPKIASEILRRGIELDVVEAVLAENKSRFIALAKSNPNCVNEFHPIGGNAYYAAALFGKIDMIWPLNRWGGDPNISFQKGEGISGFRAAFAHTDTKMASQVAMRILVDAGDPNAKQKNEDTVLHGAAALGDAGLVRAIVRRGGDVSSKNEKGETPLDVAIRMRKEDAAKVLRDHDNIKRMDRSSRFVFNASGEEYSSPVNLDVPQLVINQFGEMCHYNFSESKRIHKEYPSVIHGSASWNELGVEACAHMERPDWTKYFLDQGSPMSLSTSLAVNDVKSARRLLSENKGRINERGPHDFALMWYPQIAGGVVELAELLLEFGANIDEHKMGITCLHKAAYSGQADLVEFLIQRGASINPVGKSDFSNLIGTPLDWAKSRNRTKIIKLLKDRGALSK